MAPYPTSRRGPPGGKPQQSAEKPATGDTNSWVLHPARLPLYPWGEAYINPPGHPCKGFRHIRTRPDHRGRRELALPSPTSSIQLEERPCTPFALVIMRRPRRAGLGVLSPRRSLKLGKVRRCSCLRLIPLPGTVDVLLAPTMISHPLAYVAPNPRHHVKFTPRKMKMVI